MLLVSCASFMVVANSDAMWLDGRTHRIQSAMYVNLGIASFGCTSALSKSPLDEAEMLSHMDRSATSSTSRFRVHAGSAKHCTSIGSLVHSSRLRLLSFSQPVCPVAWFAAFCHVTT